MTPFWFILTGFSQIWHGYFTGPGFDSTSPASDNMSKIHWRPTGICVVLIFAIFLRDTFNSPALIQLAHSFAQFPVSCLMCINISISLDDSFPTKDIHDPVSVINKYIDGNDSSSMFSIFVVVHQPGASTPVTEGRCNHTK